MISFIARRLLLLIPTLIGVSILVFLITRLTPGDPVRQIVGPDAPQERIDAMRHQLGLDRPLISQYFSFVVNGIQGDLGSSIRSRQPVARELMDRFPVTLQLTSLSMFIAVGVGIPLGVLASVRRGRILDKIATALALFGASMPLFWTAILLILFFSIQRGWLPTGGVRQPLWTVDGFRSYLLPGITLSLAPIAVIMRLTRSSMLDVLDREFVTVARAKGVSEPQVILFHALRNSLLPVLTVVGLTFGSLLGGAVVTETIFSLPGLGRLVVQAINQRDYPVIQGAVMTLAIIFTLINLLVDVLYAVVDPRIRYD